MSSHATASSSASASTGGGCGCTSILLFIFVIWFLVFGLSIGGTHYSVSCTCDDGVVVNEKDNE